MAKKNSQYKGLLKGVKSSGILSSSRAKKGNTQSPLSALTKIGDLIRDIRKAASYGPSILGKISSALRSILKRAEADKEIQKRPAKEYDGPNITVIRGPKDVESSWVDKIAYIRYGRKNGVAIQFLSGAQCFYPSTDLKDYEYLRDAGSKGKAVWRRFYELPYELLS